MSDRSQLLALLTKRINNTARAEFLFEQFSLYFFQKHFRASAMLEALGVFEFFLFYNKLKKYMASGTLMYHAESEDKEFVKNHQSLEAIKTAFSYRDAKVVVHKSQRNDLKQKIRNTLSRIKETTSVDSLRSNIQRNLIQTHQQFVHPSIMPVDGFNTTSKNKLSGSLIRFKMGELIYLLRPLIHCCALIVSSNHSYKPYLISLVMDLLRLVLQWDKKLETKADQHEFKRRNIELVVNYLLRNPFYTEVLREKILDPVLDKLFPKIPLLKRLIIYGLEMRSSLTALM